MSLSDKIVDENIFYLEVKQAIKELKEKYPCCMKKRKCQKHYKLICTHCMLNFEIDKIFGKELSK